MCGADKSAERGRLGSAAAQAVRCERAATPAPDPPALSCPALPFPALPEPPDPAHSPGALGDRGVRFAGGLRWLGRSSPSLGLPAEDSRGWGSVSARCWQLARLAPPEPVFGVFVGNKGVRLRGEFAAVL